MENYSTMEARHGGGAFPSFNLDTEDDFLFLDPNLPPLDSIASDFSAFLDSTGPNNSLLPADEWSGTTNNLPDTPSSHQQLQHGLEGSSPLQPNTSQPVIQASSAKQQFVFESHVPPAGAGGGAGAVSQATSSDVLGIQQAAANGGSEQAMDGLLPGSQPGLQGRTNMQIDAQRHQTFSGRPPVMLNVSTGQQSLTPAGVAPGGATTPRELLLQSPGFQGGPAQQQQQQQQPESTVMDPHFGQQSQRNFESFQARQLAGFQGQVENGMRMSLPRGLMMNSGHLGMTGSTGAPPQVAGMPPGQQQAAAAAAAALSHIQGSDGDGVAALQTQLMNNSNHANFSGHSNALQQSQFMAKTNSRQPIIPGHGLNNIPSYQLQSPSHPLPLQGQGKLHPQVMANQVMNQGLLQPRQVPQPSVFSSGQQPSFQMLPQQGYQMHPNSANHLPFGRQMFGPQMQPRLQNQLLQGLRFGSPLGARQLGPQMVQQQQMTTGPPEVMNRYVPPGTNAAKCAQIFMLYIQEQRKRPTDNNINFWRDFVRKYFVPGATERWCLTSYSTTPVGKHAQGLFPMDYWYCNLCGVHPGRGFESGTDVLPRLFKIKYDSGLLDELLFLDAATEKYPLPAGKIVLEFARAVHESVFSELRVIRQGKLRVTFNNHFKICSWEFCTKAHDEVVPRRNLLQQVHQLASLVIESDQESFDKSAENLKNHCNAFTKAAKQLAVQLDAPMVNDLGFSKRYVRCLQIAEVVNSMKDLISFEKKTGLGPVESLAKFPTFKKLQMEGAMNGLPFSLTQMIHELTQGHSSLQTSGVTRLQSESMSEAQQEQAANQAQSSSVFKGMDSRFQHLLNSENYNQLQAAQAQSGPVQSHSMNQISQITSLSQQQQQQQQVAAPQTSGVQQQQQQQQNQQSLSNNNQIGAPQQQPGNYQQAVLKAAGAKSSLSQPQSVNQTSLPGTPQSEISDMRTNT